MFDLNDVSLSDVVRCGTWLRERAARSPGLPAAADAVVRFLADEVLDAGHGQPAFVFVSCHVDGVLVAGDRVAEPSVRSDGARAARFRPDAEFASVHGVRAGLLLCGGRFVIAAYSRTPLDQHTVGLFEIVAANIELGLLAHLDPAPGVRDAVTADLLGTLERLAASQAEQLQETVAELSGAATRLRQSQHNLRIREAQLRDETSLVETLHTVGTDLTSELDMDRVVQRATDVATELTGAKFGSFFYNVVDDLGESYLLYTLSGVDKGAFANVSMPRNTSLFDTTFRGLAVVRSDDITKDPRRGRNDPYFGLPPGHLPVVSYLAVPAISPTGEVLGGFVFGHPQPGRFTERHERLAVGVATHAAVALDNARMYRRQRLASLELQRSLLPRIPHVDGLDVVSRYLPAAKGAEVGGDWVDLVPLSAGRIALVVGDVMGKGIRAAAVMGQLRTAIRSYASLDLAPGRLMRQLNTSVATDLEAEMATCLYLVYDLVHGIASFANAGHLPVAAVRDDQPVRFLRGPVGPPLGTGDFPYTEHTVPIAPGEALLLYTDGLVERRDRGIEERLNLLLDRLRGVRPTDRALDELVAGLVDPAHHDDDIAVLFVRQPPEAVPVTARKMLPAEGASGRAARRFVARQAGAWGVPGTQIDTLVAIVAELVANATQHARTRHVEVRLHRLATRLAVEVYDQDNRLPFLIEPTFDDEHHRGLHVVRASADRWGTRVVSDGKVVWAELAD